MLRRLAWLLLLLAAGLPAAVRPAEEFAPPRFLLAWGGRGAGEGEFHSPIGIAVDQSDRVHVTDHNNARVQVFDTEGRLLRSVPVAGKPGGIALDRAGRLYLSLFDRDRIAVHSPDGEPLRSWGAPGAGDGEFRFPAGLAVGPDGAVYLGDDVNRRIQKFSPEGVFLAKWGEGGAGPGQFGGEGTDRLPENFRTSGPNFLAFDSAGVLHATDGRGGKVHRFTQDGRFLSAWGSNEDRPGGFGGRPRNLPGPTGICIDRRDRVWVAATNNRVQWFTAEGRYLGGFGGGGAGAGEFRTPHGLALDSRGHLYVVDTQNHRVQKFAP